MNHHKLEIVTDIKKCEQVWKTLSENQKISDMWEFKLCFHKYFDYSPYFVVQKKGDEIIGLLPLSYDKEKNCFRFFPGDDDWIEKNPIFFKNKHALKKLIDNCPENTILTCIEEHPYYKKLFNEHYCTYSLIPKELGYDINNYFKLFQRKHVRNIFRDIRKLKAQGVEIIRDINKKELYQYVTKWNIDTFGEKSFFDDKKFTEAFNELFNFFKKKNIIYLVGVKVGGELAAVDFGCVYKNVLTLLAGGVNPKFRNQGIAKLINLEHIKFAFENKIDRVEFLGFNFHWKEQWHLKKEKMFLFCNNNELYHEKDTNTGECINE